MAWFIQSWKNWLLFFTYLKWRREQLEQYINASCFAHNLCYFHLNDTTHKIFNDVYVHAITKEKNPSRLKTLDRSIPCKVKLESISADFAPTTATLISQPRTLARKPWSIPFTSLPARQRTTSSLHNCLAASLLYETPPRQLLPFSPRVFPRTHTHRLQPHRVA